VLFAGNGWLKQSIFVKIKDFGYNQGHCHTGQFSRRREAADARVVQSSPKQTPPPAPPHGQSGQRVGVGPFDVRWQGRGTRRGQERGAGLLQTGGGSGGVEGCCRLYLEDRRRCKASSRASLISHLLLFAFFGSFIHPVDVGQPKTLKATPEALSFAHLLCTLPHQA